MKCRAVFWRIIKNFDSDISALNQIWGPQHGSQCDCKSDILVKLALTWRSSLIKQGLLRGRKWMWRYLLFPIDWRCVSILYQTLMHSWGCFRILFSLIWFIYLLLGLYYTFLIACSCTDFFDRFINVWIILVLLGYSVPDFGILKTLGIHIATIFI